MSYTLLRVLQGGVVLYNLHARRLAPQGGPILQQFELFARSARPGVYALCARDGLLHATERGESRLTDGMPVRYAVSPFADRRGRFPKPRPPSTYDTLRLTGVATLLTSADGTELLESCSAAIVGWDGERLIFPPLDRPRVDSTAEGALRAAVSVAEEPFPRGSSGPLALINAVKGLCLVDVPGREPFPEEARRMIEEVLERSIRRA